MPDRRALGAAFAVFLMVAATMTAFTGWMYLDRMRHLEHSTGIIATQARSFLTAWIYARLTGVEDLADRTVGMDAAAFTGAAQRLRERWPGLRAVNWVDTDGVIRVIVPEEGNGAVLERNLFDHPDPDVSRALGEAVAGRTARTGTVSLLQGGEGFVVYWPVVGLDGSVQGVVNGVFGIEALMTSSRLAAEIGGEHWLELRDPDGTLTWSNAPEPASRWRLASTAAIRVLGSDWVVSVAPTPARIRSTAAVAQLVGLASAGWILGGLLAVGVWRRVLELPRTPFRTPLDDTPAVLGIGIDVSERHAEEALRRRIAEALDQAGEAIAVLDARGRVEFANEAFRHMMGVGDRDVRGLTVDAFAVDGSSDDRLIADIRETLMRGETWKRRYTSQWGDGARVRDATVTPFHDDSGRLAGYVGVLRDVTRETQLEIELRQSQKLEAVGRLSGGIAHDFNNLLTVILGFAEMLRDAVPAQGPAAQAATEIEAAAERAAALIRKLLAFSRRGAATATADLNESVEGTMAMVGRLIGENIAVTLELTDGRTSVAADRGEIEQILVNLCLNARDAMPGGGRLTIATHLAAAGDGPPALHDRDALAPYVVLKVVDEGVGMSAEVQQRIFEPFFTTKGVGAGTGLGLSTVYGIAEQRGGAVHVRSVPGAGTMLSVWLPAAEPAADCLAEP